MAHFREWGFNSARTADFVGSCVRFDYEWSAEKIEKLDHRDKVLSRSELPSFAPVHEKQLKGWAYQAAGVAQEQAFQVVRNPFKNKKRQGTHEALLDTVALDMFLTERIC